MMTLRPVNWCASNKIILIYWLKMRDISLHIQYETCYNFFDYDQNLFLKVSFDSKLHEEFIHYK